MNWIEVSIEVDGEAAEAVADVLQRYGHQGVAIEQAGFPIEVWPDEIPPADKLIVRAYFPDNHEADAAQQRLREALWHMSRLYPIPEPSFRTVDDEDWANAWKAHYHPLRLGKRLYIRPEWTHPTDMQPDDVVLVMDPGMAFGTGTHPTTQLCLIAIEDLLADWPQVEVLDLGCGSGILGIAAIKLGARHVLAVDIDELAVKSTLENAAYNGVTDAITAQQGSLETLRGSARHFDLLLANILARVIIDMCDEGLGDLVRAGGKAVFSGIILDQADDVEAALRRTGLEPTRRRTITDWVAIEAVKPVA
ncbi:50S ribosomal protein L11 methyltransferase [Aggregatilinea lenta]|uniref:50S ribosomal protein L11 methyltransferase n=1 Tax=Aggregatilinea lenta TaxID=913108 RepID=UPI000E5A891A|nr:50S ribosomal protein L11 methyltransferase [Aggregatilinea lenta]